MSTDCKSVVNLARSLHMDEVTPGVMKEIEMNCCSEMSLKIGGIACDEKQNVISISWSAQWNLYGSINTSAIPPNLALLDLSFNDITGTIPISLPASLLNLNLYQNQFTGAIPEDLPNRLQYLLLSYNDLTGTLPTSLPGELIELYLQNNLLTGNLPSFPKTLTRLYLGLPLLLGNYLSGIIRLNQPKELYLANNYITDLLILDSSNLDHCDISNNPLLGNPNIANLSQCAQKGLYTRTSTFARTADFNYSTYSIVSTAYSSLFDASSLSTNNNQYDSTTYIPYIPTQLVQPALEPLLLFSLIGGFFALCVVVIIARLVIKNPKSHSKYGRKNSFGTLNTIASKASTSKTI